MPPKILFTTVFRLFFIFLALNMLLSTCANVVEPEGGPKDEALPRLIASCPAHGSTQFKGKKIQLIFDKDIAVEDLNKKLVVMPRLEEEKGKKAYTYTVSGSVLKITLSCPLKEDTTYNFSFNDAIKDLREGNKAENATLTFSTGETLDALSVEGNVRDLLKDEPVEHVRVCLYNIERGYINQDINDTIDKKKNEAAVNEVIIDTEIADEVEKKDEKQKVGLIPDYFIKTDKEGKFKLSYIKEGKYYIRASTGESTDFAIDYEKDMYGFLETPLEVSSPLHGITIPIVKGDVSNFKLVRSTKNDQFFEIVCSKPIISYTLTATKKLRKTGMPPIIYSHLTGDKKVISVYNTLGLLEEDSIEVQLVAKDILEGVLEETITVQFKEEDGKQEPLKCTVTPASGTKIMPEFKGKIAFSKPLREIIVENMYFVYDKGDHLNLTNNEVQLNTQRDELTIAKQFPLPPTVSTKITDQQDTSKEGEKEHELILYLPTGSVIAADKDKNEESSFHYTFKDVRKHGTICGKVVTNAPGFIIQLLDKNYEVVDEIRNEKEYQFKMVAPGSYKVRVLALKAPNMEWSFGNILKNIPPDPVAFYQDEVAVVENWEIRDIDFEF